MSGPYLLGIDNGTSFVKSVAFDLSGHEIAIARRETPVLSLHPNWSEMDMGGAWSLCAETIAEVVAAVGADNITAVGISGTACGVWAVDADLQPIRSAILWNDGRAHEVVAEWQANGTTARIFELSGNALFPGYPVAALRWLMAHEPHNFERIRWYLHHKDWLRLNLTGEIFTEEADAAYFPFDIGKRRFSDELLQITGLSGFRDKLPEILRSHDVAGTITAQAAAQTGLREGTPVIAGAVDVVVSTLGGGAIRPGQACSILGTSSLNSLVLDAPSFKPFESGVQACMPDNYWLQSLVNTTGTTSIQWLVDNFASDERARAERENRSVYDCIEDTISSVPAGSNGIVFLPFLSTAGIISPFADANARAQFFGVSIEHTRADFMRSVYEGVALSMRDCYESSGRPVDEIILVGGGARSAFWAQMFADATGHRLVIPEGTEFGARGAALLAGVGTGVFGSFEEAIAATVRPAKTFEPRPDAAQAYSAMYELYIHLVNSSRDGWLLRRKVLEALG